MLTGHIRGRSSSQLLYLTHKQPLNIFDKKVEGGCQIFVSLWQCEHIPGQYLVGGETAAVRFDIRHLLLGLI